MLGSSTTSALIAAMLGADTATINDNLNGFGGGFGAGPDHAEQYGMDPREQGDIAPVAQSSTQGRTGSAADTGEQLAPLDAFAQKEL